MLTTIAQGIATDAAPAALVGTVYPPEGFASWEDYEDSFWPYWNEEEQKWEK